jgi:putative transposase
MATTALKRQAVAYIQDHYGLRTQRAFGLIRQARSTHYYRSVKDPQAALHLRVIRPAET